MKIPRPTASQPALPGLPAAAPARRPSTIDRTISLTWFARMRQTVEAAHEIQPYEHKFGHCE